VKVVLFCGEVHLLRTDIHDEMLLANYGEY
jgi:hypothetical protein